MVRFRILGQFEVDDETGPTDIAAAKPRALLALLLVRANAVVASDRLVDDLWDGRPPASATNTLQTYVSQLRKVLPADRVVTRAPGYMLRVEPGEVDAAEFENALRHADRPGLSSPARASELRGALAMWRGPVLQEFSDAAWAQPEIARVEGLRVAALETCIELEMRAGSFEAVIPELEALVREYPLRERIWALFIRALYRAGRQADALRAYDALRRTLVEELGIEPSAQLAELQRAVLEQQAPFDDAEPSVSVLRPEHRPLGVVTFLLTDLVGSTALWEAMPDAMTDAVVLHNEVIARAVRDHGGTFLKARGEGDSTFSVFAKATDALAAAVDARAQLTESTWPGAVKLSVRIALHTGESVELDDDYLGPAVNRAARVREQAGGGEIVISSATAELVRDHVGASLALTDLGERELRGMQRPERIYAVRDADDHAASSATELSSWAPMPSALRARAVGPFVDREVLRARVEEVWGALSGGPATVILFEGEAGIGKSRLAAEAASACAAQGATVFFGGCDETLRVPYAPFVPVVERVLNRLGSEGRVPIAPEIRRLVPGLVSVSGTARVVPHDPEAERLRLFGEVSALLEQCTRSMPVVIVLDDLQWADAPTLELFKHLVAGEFTGRLLVLGTIRSSDLAPDDLLSDVLADFRRLPNVVRLELDGLASGDLATLAGVLGGESVNGERLGDALFRETDGNPFFALELIRHVIESGSDTRTDVHGTAPPSVREVVSVRVHRLGQTAERVLRVAAVIGNEFDVTLLGAVVRMSLEEVLDVVELGVARGLLREEGDHPDVVRFAHGLVRHALYLEIGAARRRLLHEVVADEIEAERARSRRR